MSLETENHIQTYLDHCEFRYARIGKISIIAGLVAFHAGIARLIVGEAMPTWPIALVGCVALFGFITSAAMLRQLDGYRLLLQAPVAPAR